MFIEYRYKYRHVQSHWLFCASVRKAPHPKEFIDCFANKKKNKKGLGIGHCSRVERMWRGNLIYFTVNPACEGIMLIKARNSEFSSMTFISFTIYSTLAKRRVKQLSIKQKIYF